MGRVDSEAGVPRFDLVASFDVTVSAPDVCPKRTDAINDRRKATENPLQVVVFNGVRRQLQLFRDRLPQRLDRLLRRQLDRELP